MLAPSFVSLPVAQALAPRWAAGVTTLWCLPLDIPEAWSRRLLAPISLDERRRAASLRLPGAGMRALAARGWLRGLLGAVVGVAPAELQFGLGAHGKPALTWPASPWRYSLSHTQGWMLLALSDSIDPGADLEMTRKSANVLAVAERHFTPIETDYLRGLPEAERARAFLRLWTCKEAVLKAMGRGIAFGLARLQVDIASGPAQLLAIASEAGAASDWQLLELEPGEGLIGALAWHGPTQTVQAFQVALDGT